MYPVKYHISYTDNQMLIKYYISQCDSYWLNTTPHKLINN